MKSRYRLVSVNIKLQKDYLNLNPHVLHVHLITSKFRCLHLKKLCFLYKPASVGLAVACCPTQLGRQF